MPDPENRVRSAQPKVALLFEASNADVRGILRGDYILTPGSWRLHLAFFGMNDHSPAWLASWNGQGIIVRGENRRMANAGARTRIPAIDMSRHGCWWTHDMKIPVPMISTSGMIFSIPLRLQSLAKRFRKSASPQLNQ